MFVDNVEVPLPLGLLAFIVALPLAIIAALVVWVLAPFWLFSSQTTVPDWVEHLIDFIHTPSEVLNEWIGNKYRKKGK
jgi:fatty acid desaturase